MRRWAARRPGNEVGLRGDKGGERPVGASATASALAVGGNGARSDPWLTWGVGSGGPRSRRERSKGPLRCPPVRASPGSPVYLSRQRVALVMRTS